jgi:hypothetical protein
MNPTSFTSETVTIPVIHTKDEENNSSISFFIIDFVCAELESIELHNIETVSRALVLTWELIGKALKKEFFSSMFDYWLRECSFATEPASRRANTLTSSRCSYRRKFQ